MRKTKMQMAAFALAAGILLGGCGDEPYELTESEEDIIVNYAAHVVTKYNSAQSEGLTYVYPEMLEEDMPEETAPENPPVTETAPENQQGMAPGSAETPQQAQPSLETASLQELFGFGGIEISYVGSYVSPGYTEDAYYALDASAGKTFLVVGIDVLNLADGTVEMNNLALNPKFMASVNGGAYCPAQMTILTKDFSTLELSLGGGAKVETVMLFEVPDTVTEIQSLDLKVSVSGTEYQINL